jgi:hypothetical protein
MTSPFDFRTDEDEEPRSSYRRPERQPISNQTIFLTLVGGLVAIVMLLILYDRAEGYYYKKRLEVLRQEYISLGLRQTAYPMGSAEWDAIDKRMADLDYQERRILQNNPSLR